MKLDTARWSDLVAAMALLVMALEPSMLARASPPDAPVAAFKRDVEEIASTESEDRANKIRRSYLNHFGTDPIDPLASTESLKDRLYALATVAHHAPDDRLGHQAAAIAILLQARQAAGPDEIRYVHRMLLAERDFEGASRWSKRFAQINLTTTPIVERMSGDRAYNAYAVSADGARLLELQLDMQSYSGLLILGHPACGFSRNAAAWLSNFASMAHTPAVRWLAPVEGNLQLPLIAGWNAAHQDQALLIARHERDWPFVTAWDTPQFFIFSDGRLQFRLDGWNEENQRVLREWLELQGHLTGDALIREQGTQ